MRQWMIGIMNAWGYNGILFLIAVENLFPPIPSEAILAFGGFMTTCTNMGLWYVILAATAGSLIGAIILYGVGRWLGSERLMTLLDGKLGRFLHFRRADMQQAIGWFDRKGVTAVFFCRFVPIIRSLISVPAGMAGMPLLPFLVMTIGGSLIWNTVLCYLGALAGNSWEKIVGCFGTYSDIVTMGFMVLIPIIVMYMLRKKRKGD